MVKGTGCVGKPRFPAVLPAVEDGEDTAVVDYACYLDAMDGLVVDAGLDAASEELLDEVFCYGEAVEEGEFTDQVRVGLGWEGE